MDGDNTIDPQAVPPAMPADGAEGEMGITPAPAEDEMPA